ncbi:MAG TPA: hypothetical protein GXX50_11805 [Firmicutes bacterium]|mgnify:FL=1|jgi:hypothetical protein|uniref:hypothetical protein n=1 Tax=Gelria sp. Kuro-4 TaxID=2796927 RepID=UPI0019BBCAB0|nr:hypothetical protein [Gelria sp. Kuro-4]BCV23710.1 hypothetical protein kuro4_04830 [Gelria sp. Kuro-4]HHV58419.1 hypothetical protein [Bacillota bacterium]
MTITAIKILAVLGMSMLVSGLAMKRRWLVLLSIVPLTVVLYHMGLLFAIGMH